MNMHPLRAYRERKGLTQDALAALVCATPATISRIESGKGRPSVRMIHRLVGACDGEITADVLIAACFAGDPTPVRAEAAAG